MITVDVLFINGASSFGHISLDSLKPGRLNERDNSTFKSRTKGKNGSLCYTATVLEKSHKEWSQKCPEMFLGGH